MDQPIYTAEKEQEVVNQWLFQDVVEFEKEKEELRQKRQEIEDIKKQLDLDRQSLDRKIAAHKQKMDHEEKLFEMKWKLLETEVANLARERENFDYKTKEFQTSILEGMNAEGLKCSLLFRGVDNELALKKRYRDLMKIYHPDNIAGDTNAVKEISREYEELKTQFRSRY